MCPSTMTWLLISTMCVMLSHFAVIHIPASKRGQKYTLKKHICKRYLQKFDPFMYYRGCFRLVWGLSGRELSAGSMNIKTYAWRPAQSFPPDRDQSRSGSWSIRRDYVHGCGSGAPSARPCIRSRPGQLHRQWWVHR